MKELENNIERIERLISGDLPENEQAELKKQIEEDPEYASLFKSIYATVKAVERKEEAETRAMLKRIHQEVIIEGKAAPLNERKNSRIISLVFKITAVAAVLAALLFSAYWFLQKPSSSTLYTAYYEVETFDVTRSSNTQIAQIDSLFRIARTAYLAKDYESSIKELDLILSLAPSDYHALLYTGSANLELNRPEAAITNFSEIQDGLLEEKAIWYTALAYLKLEDIPAAKKELQKIVDGTTLTVSPSFKSKASELLRKLR